MPRAARTRVPALVRRTVEPIARFGFAARAAVYVTIGVLAARAAAGRRLRPTDAEGALRTVGQQDHGELLLIVLGLGLAAYALWRFAQAVYDLDGKGGGLRGLVARVGFFLSGLIHGGLALTAMGILAGARSGNRNTVRLWVARILSEPMGAWVVGGAGLAILGAGIYQLYKAYTAEFDDRLETSRLSASCQRWLDRVGRLGLTARGVTFGIIGWFLIRAAVSESAREARGLAGALRTLQQQAWGPWLLGAVGLGLIAYGLHSLSFARYRRILT